MKTNGITVGERGIKTQHMCCQLKRAKSDKINEEHVLSHTVVQVSPYMWCIAETGGTGTGQCQYCDKRPWHCMGLWLAVI